jgi:hypothetical protein
MCSIRVSSIIPNHWNAGKTVNNDVQVFWKLSITVLPNYTLKISKFTWIAIK